jgi:DMSO reductase family type II enzyme heme b subunit
MRARYVPTAELEALLDPDAPGWTRAGSEDLKLQGTPLGMQPTGHIRAAWSARKIGSVARVAVAAAHDGRVLAFRLEWNAASECREPKDNDQFPDAAAVMLPAPRTLPSSPWALPAWP